MNSGMNLTELANDYRRVRAQTEALASLLSAEDQCVQSMPDASPTKWHRAHTTWFFDTFVLRPSDIDAGVPPEFEVLFNSYYNAVGEQFDRPSRGLLTRPSLEEVSRYREGVDECMLELLAAGVDDETAETIVLGLHHEQQHQELIVTDVKHLLSLNPIFPAYTTADRPSPDTAQSPIMRWTSHPGGVTPIGIDGDGFRFDNEGPRHEVLLQPFLIAQRLVTNAEYLAFMDDGGYHRPDLWLSAGWAHAQQSGWEAPAYWFRSEGNDASLSTKSSWDVFTLHGLSPLRPGDPVTHVSYYEADAYARWADARLPTEHEWETATAEPETSQLAGRTTWTHAAQPRIYGACWQWTSSSYAPYPRYRPATGAIGEYNGKFMCGQYVLRGSSFATPAGHARRTYRNFFPPDARWQLSGLRLARDSD